MNNGLYVGPIISQLSPRWRVQEYMGVSNDAGTPVRLQGGVLNPQVPLNASAVRMTVVAGAFANATTPQPAASCHNVVWPTRGKQIFIEHGATGTVSVWLVNPATLANFSTGGVGATVCEHGFVLSGSGAGTPSYAVYAAQSGTPYITSSSAGQILPYFNGMLAHGGSPSGAGNSMLNAPIVNFRSGTTSNRASSGNIMYPVRSGNYGTAGTGSPDSATAFTAPWYVRLEYLL